MERTKWQTVQKKKKVYNTKYRPIRPDKLARYRKPRC